MSGYIPGFEHDIFISYAWVDDAVHGSERGWVSELVEHLRTEVAASLCNRCEPLSVFSDRGIDSDRPVRPELEKAVRGSAIFVPVVSKQWLTSPWCRRELEWFLHAGGRKRPIFPVWLYDKDLLKDVPPALYERGGHEFWRREQSPTKKDIIRKFGKPIPDSSDPEHKAFFYAVEDLGSALASRMDELVLAEPPSDRSYGFDGSSERGSSGVAPPVELSRFKPDPTLQRESYRNAVAVKNALFVIDRGVADGSSLAAMRCALESMLPSSIRIDGLDLIPEGTRFRLIHGDQVIDAYFGPTEAAVRKPGAEPVETGVAPGVRHFAFYDGGRVEGADTGNGGNRDLSDASAWLWLRNLRQFSVEVLLGRKPLFGLFGVLVAFVTLAGWGVYAIHPKQGILSKPANNDDQLHVTPIAEDINTGVEFQHCEACPLMVVVQAGVSQVSARGKSKLSKLSLRDALLSTFAVSKHEITFAQFDFFCEQMPEHCKPYPHDHGFGRGPMPVVDVTWVQADAYATWLSGLTKEEYRIPSSAEWEAIALAGNDVCGPRGMGSGAANRPVPATNATPNTENRWRINQLSGNVAEWVSDCCDPTAGSTCRIRVVRGPSWCDKNDADWCSRSVGMEANMGHAHVGFRLVLHKRRPLIKLRPSPAWSA